MNKDYESLIDKALNFIPDKAFETGVLSLAKYLDFRKALSKIIDGIEQEHKEEMREAITETAKVFAGEGGTFVQFTDFGKDNLNKCLKRYGLIESGKEYQGDGDADPQSPHQFDGDLS